MKLIFIFTLLLTIMFSKLAFCEDISEEQNIKRIETSDESPKITLKVMTMNIRHNSDFWEERFHLIADEIVRLKPDLIGFQEVEIGIEQSKVLRNLIIERTTQEPLNYNFYERLKTGSYMFFGEGIANFSLLPIEKSAFLDLEYGRIVLFTRVKIDENLFIDFYNTHLHNTGGDEVRLPQAEKIVDFINKNSAENIVFLTGDMNAYPDSDTIKHFISNSFIDTFKELHGDKTPEIGNTSPIVLLKKNIPQNPVNRIDYVFYKLPQETQNKQAEVKIIDSIICFKNFNEEGLYPSDHLGVMTTVEISFPLTESKQ